MPQGALADSDQEEERESGSAYSEDSGEATVSAYSEDSGEETASANSKNSGEATCDDDDEFGLGYSWRGTNKPKAPTPGDTQDKRPFYAVQKGRTVGIFRTWEECESSVRGVSGATHKKFKTREEAEDYLGYPRAKRRRHVDDEPIHPPHTMGRDDEDDNEPGRPNNPHPSSWPAPPPATPGAPPPATTNKRSRSSANPNKTTSTNHRSSLHLADTISESDRSILENIILTYRQKTSSRINWGVIHESLPDGPLRDLPISAMKEVKSNLLKTMPGGAIESRRERNRQMADARGDAYEAKLKHRRDEARTEKGRAANRNNTRRKRDKAKTKPGYHVKRLKYLADRLSGDDISETDRITLENAILNYHQNVSTRINWDNLQESLPDGPLKLLPKPALWRIKTLLMARLPGGTNERMREYFKRIKAEQGPEYEAQCASWAKSNQSEAGKASRKATKKALAERRAAAGQTKNPTLCWQRTKFQQTSTNTPAANTTSTNAVTT